MQSGDRPTGPPTTASGTDSVQHGMSRRRFLGYAGALTGVATGGLLPWAERADAAEARDTAIRVHRWAMVIDLRRCDGCSGIGLPPQCTQYCIWGHLAPQGMQWIEVFDTTQSNLPGAPGRFLPAPCMQCQNAPCANVCPVGATFHTPEGTVLIDQERCIGCRLCMAACPYDRRFFNWGEPVQPEYATDQPYDVLDQVPAIKGTVMKCDFCTDLAEAGGISFCADACPQGAIYYGDLEEDVATNGVDFVRLSTFIEENHATPYKEELGTEPRVFYIAGDGELASESSADPRDREFLKGNLEWPWARIQQALEGQAPVGASSTQGGSDA